MKKTIKKFFAGFLSFVLIITTMLALGINVVFAETSGDCTTTIKWSYNTTNKTLTLTGTGVMPDYRATNLGTNKKSPWESNKVGTSTIKSIMENLVVGEGITEIGEYNFFNCEALKSVSLPSTLKSIDGMGAGTDLASASYGAFQGCASLTEINLPAGLETIEPYAFKNCTSLKSIAFPDSLKTLGKCAFLLCSSLETVTFGTGLTAVSDNAFNSCGVKRINWGSITEISTQSFYACNIKDIEFPDQITSIGTRAFANNTSLMNVTVNNANMEFKGTNSNTSNNFSGSNQTVTIIGHSASTAQTFANSYGYNFVSMDDCDHTDTRTEVVLEPNCTEPGQQRVVCNNCGFIVSETEIEALGHDFVLTDTQDSTELDGHIYRYYKCSRCNADNVEVEHQHLPDSATNYIWIDGYYTVSYMGNVEPTCTTPGIAVYTCDIEGCKNILGNPTSERKVITAGHKVSSWSETPATCTQDGKKTGVCTECGETVEETISATGHSYDETDLIETIEGEEDGHIYYYFDCKKCDETIVEKEHVEWVEDCYTRNLLTTPTCTVPGLARDTCDICGETRTTVIQATGEHEYEEESRTEPDCTKMGTVTYRCKNCDQTKTEYIAALGHDYVVDEELSKAPTCTESGKRVSLCSRCAASKTETLDATGHTPKEGTYAVITEPTCTKNGLAVATCEVCNNAYETTVEALGHDYDDVETDLTSEGKPGHVLAVPTCTRCGATQNGKIVHKEWVEGYYTTVGDGVATCVTTYTTDTCAIKGCNETRINQLPGIGHSYFYVSQDYKGVSLMCRHCLTSTVVDPAVLLEYWEEIAPINMAPNRTETDNSGYLDLDRNGIINAKDYARILKLVDNQEKLIQEHYQAEGERYNRTFVDGGELTPSSTTGLTGKLLNIQDNTGYDLTFTPAASGTYTFYAIGTVDSFAYLEVDGEDIWEVYDDNSGTSNNFLIEFYCEEGVTYHLKTGLVDENATGRYYVYVSLADEETDDGEEGTGGSEGTEGSGGTGGTGGSISDIIGGLIP